MNDEQYLVIDLNAKIYGPFDTEDDAQYELYKLELKHIPACACKVLGWNDTTMPSNA